jgi:hypothetical protein
MLKSHLERGLSMPPSSFFMNLLKFYGLQLHHIGPNSLVSVAGYAALCEGFLGIRPRVDSSSFSFLCGPITRMMGFSGPMKQSAFFREGLKNIPSSLLWIPPSGGEVPGSIWRISLRYLKPAAFFLLRT